MWLVCLDSIFLFLAKLFDRFSLSETLLLSMAVPFLTEEEGEHFWEPALLDIAGTSMVEADFLRYITVN